MSKITYIYPSRSRRLKFFQGLENIKSLSASDNYEIICSLDSDDLEMNRPDVKTQLDGYENVRYFYGTSYGKISACNREINNITEDTSIVCLHSDDMQFLKHGFDNDIREAFEQYFPDYSGVIHFPDNNAVDRTMTYTMMGINLFNKLGYLYHPSFISVFADNHLTEMTRKMGKYAFVNKRILDHLHPIWNLAEWDSQYRKSECAEYYQKDQLTYSRLKTKNFELK